MKIKRIHIYKRSLPLIEPFIIALGPIDQAQNVVVKVETEGGDYGLGECSPYPTIHGETQEGNWVIGQWMARGWIGKEALDIEERMKELDRLITGNPCIKSAFDMALYDLKAKSKGMPLYQMLGGGNEGMVVTDMTVSLNGVPEMVAQAMRFARAGFPVLKIKLGGTPEEDVKRIVAIRQAIGMELPLRIDANQGWTVDAAIGILRALAPYHIQHCEAPVPRWNRLGLVEVRQQSPIPIMVDEALFDHHDVQQLLQMQAVDRFNIKLGKAGGIHKALRIARLATEAGIACQVGSFSESKLGISALLHFAKACTCVKYFDLDAPLMLAEDQTLNGLQYEAGGKVRLPDGPGIGADLAEAYLQSLESVSIGAKP
ncbi:MAG: dipeptide epimerase [Bacteroidota bacterium]